MVFTDGTHAEVELVDNYKNIQQSLDIDIFTVLNIKVGGRNYTMYCDDEGLLKNEPIFTAICMNADNYYIAGNILLFKSHGSYNRSLDEHDIEMIKYHINKTMPHPNVAEHVLRFEF
jgi:hypothetical protein